VSAVPGGGYVAVIELSGGRMVATSAQSTVDEALAAASSLVPADLPAATRAVLPVVESADELAGAFVEAVTA
jgi:hypothetical protein